MWGMGNPPVGTNMYKTILVTVDGTSTDRAIIEHVKPLAKLAQSRVVVLHVADGWAARTYGSDAVSREILEDTAYLARVRAEFQAEGISAEAEMAYGDPAREIAVRHLGFRRNAFCLEFSPNSCQIRGVFQDFAADRV